MRRSREFRISHEVLERTRASAPAGTPNIHSDDALTYDEMKPYLRFLPEKEQDIIEMYFFRGKRQKDIAVFFGVSQGAISHRISRSMERLRFLKGMPKISNEDLRKALAKVLDPVDMEISCTMVRTTCQSETAKKVNKALNLQGKEALTQIKVRHRFAKSISIVEESLSKSSDLKIKEALSLMKYVDDGGLYMLHEVKLPHFDRGYRAEI